MSHKQEVLTIQLQVGEVLEVKGSTQEAAMILFTGTADCENFRGAILPGGVDTQKQAIGQSRTLSARYILKGVDKTGEPCQLFIENNAILEDGVVKETTPTITTDSKALAYLETANLTGTITPAPDGIVIHIFCEHDA